MLIVVSIINAICLLAAARLVYRLVHPEAAPAIAESFAAVPLPARPSSKPARIAGQPLWLPWHDKETRTC